MLLMDGVRYEEWTPPDEAVLAGMVKEHARDIFGEASIYLDIRHKLKGGSVAAIPDAYAITFNPDQWWVIEVELSSHPVYEHIVNQLSRFINGARDPQTRSELVEAFYAEITADQQVRMDLVQKRGQEVHRFLSQIVAQPAQYVVAIDKKVPQLDAAVQALAVQPKIVEFRTFRKGAETVHIHQFDPMFKLGTVPLAPPETPPGTIVVPPQEELELEVRPYLGHPYVPTARLGFFPESGVQFQVESDTGGFLAQMGSKSARNHIHGHGIREWVRQHPGVSERGRIVFAVIEPRKRYRLSVVKQ